MLFGALKAFGNRWIGMLVLLETSLPESDLLINDIGHELVLYVIKYAPLLRNHIPPASVLPLNWKLPHWTMPVNPIFFALTLNPITVHIVITQWFQILVLLPPSPQCRFASLKGNFQQLG